MQIETIHIIITILSLGIAALVAILLMLLTKNRIRDEDLLEAKKILQKREQEAKEERYKKLFFKKESSYEYKALSLSRMGVNYHIGRIITPTEYLMIQLAGAAFFLFIGIFSFGVLGITAGIFGYFLPQLLFQYLNEKDNEKMLPDIKSIFDTMLVNLEAGVFLTEAVADSYRHVENRRLKKALLELNSELIATNDFEESISKFELKFSNKYINNLCVILKQSRDSGMSVEMLSDMSSYMTDVSRALNIKKQKKLDGEGLKVEVMLYIGIIAACLYITLSTFGDSMSQLF